MRSVKVDASPVAGALAVKESCFFSSVLFEHAVNRTLEAMAQAMNNGLRVNNIDNPFSFDFIKTERQA
ncbi:hypothetical protein D3C81_1981140 [compost metagenome]